MKKTEKAVFGHGGKNEEYLAKIFSILRKRDEIVIVDEKTYFNKTELRLLREIVSAKTEGNRLISTQLAKRLGVTRSAVSQIVNRLEARGVLTRVSDEKDRKIAYIELSDSIVKQYGEDISRSLTFIGKVVAEFGEDNFNRMYELFNSFVELTKTRLKEESKKGK